MEMFQKSLLLGLLTYEKWHEILRACPNILSCILSNTHYHLISRSKLGPRNKLYKPLKAILLIFLSKNNSFCLLNEKPTDLVKRTTKPKGKPHFFNEVETNNF